MTLSLIRKIGNPAFQAKLDPEKRKTTPNRRFNAVFTQDSRA
jgi:hypothetical protein